MGFLDNSGDIILDAVLTDLGRQRLARGDGSFNIAKFALADDEIDYSKYNGSHTSGSAYYDLSILQTPILEAFTNNAASMKSKLVSYTRDNLLYLPVIKLNENFESSTAMTANDIFYVAVDQDTEDSLSANSVLGVLFGASPTRGGSYLRLDQGIDSTEIPASFVLDADLVETQYQIEIDNRFGQIVDRLTGQAVRISFVDDDNIGYYYVSLNTNPGFVSENNDTSTSNTQIIRGPRGTILRFKIKASINLNTSNYLFNLLGGTVTINSVDYYYIDSYIRIFGGSTGYGIDVPLRFLKKV